MLKLGQACASPRHIRAVGVSGQATARPWRIRGAGAPGQASTELISLMGIFLLVILVFAVLSSNILFDLNAQKNLNMARDTAQKLARAADSVYAQGEGAATTVSVQIPPTAELSGGRSYIGKPGGAPQGAASTTININVGGSDEYAITTAQLSGAFPSSPGSYEMKVTSHGTYVSIGSGLIDITPSTLFVESTAGQAKTSHLNITLPSGNGSEVYIALSYSPVHPNAALSLDKPSFSTSANTSVTLTFTPNANAGGIYNWVLQVNASGCGPEDGEGCPADHFAIPVSLEIEGG